MSVSNIFNKFRHLLILQKSAILNVWQGPKYTTGIWYNAQKIKFSIKGFFSKFDQIQSFLRICSYLLKKFLMENFIFCAVVCNSYLKLLMNFSSSKTTCILINYRTPALWINEYFFSCLWIKKWWYRWSHFPFFSLIDQIWLVYWHLNCCL